MLSVLVSLNDIPPFRGEKDIINCGCFHSQDSSFMMTRMSFAVIPICRQISRPRLNVNVISRLGCVAFSLYNLEIIRL